MDINKKAYDIKKFLIILNLYNELKVLIENKYFSFNIIRLGIIKNILIKIQNEDIKNIFKYSFLVLGLYI